MGPIKFECGHIFCEACISEWLTREATCPMCRALVRQPGTSAHHYSDGSTALLPQLF